MRRPAKKLRETLGSNVRQLRQSRNWSQEELSARADLSQTYVSQLESCQRAVTIDVIDQLARALGVSADQLLKK
ncbi:helix-turn-helix domain-containing protein [Sinimarinibacterium flocculans]|jgi:transcriptional regulator with XRE-family HTH domain|uniref:helix-turn-helix domain-containing protein n=1 Tax=Sinimarinibacterium flocculans TaxID=985250 RepID=UPI003517BD17